MTSLRIAPQLAENGYVFCPWCGQEIFREEVHCPYCGHEPFTPREECLCKKCSRLRREWRERKQCTSRLRHHPWSYLWPQSGKKKNRHN